VTDRRTIKTWTARIYLGFGGSPWLTVPLNFDALEFALCEFCGREGLCVSVSPVAYVYPGGSEPGASVMLINYPRFPDHLPDETPGLRSKAERLAELLRVRFNQKQVSVVFDDETVTIGEFDE